MALTYEQFKKLKEAGYTPEKIAELEKRRTKESQVGQKIQTQTEQPSGILSNVLGAGKAVGGFLGELAKDITKPVVSSIVSPIQLAKKAKNYYGDEDVQKRASEAMRGIDPDKQAKHTDDLYKALKTAETEEEKASIIKLMQEDLNKYVKGIQEKPIKEEVDTSVTLPFYGEIEAPKTAKEVAGRALETAALGAGGTAKVGVTTGKSLFKRALTGPGSKIGTTYGAGSALSENKSLGETALQAGIGGIFGGATDLALIGGGKGLQKLGEKLQKPATKTAQQTKEEIAGRVITGKTKDRAVGVKALESIDTKNVKTFKDLEDKFSSKITELSKNIDKKLDKDTSVQKLKDLTTKGESISGKEVKTNYVKTALEHLQEVYKKTGDMIGVQNTKDTIKKATTIGLTKKEINNIARSYGVEFGKKAFSKTGEPLTSVNSKLYETVRKGLKEKARETAAGLGTKEMDKTMSAIYRTRDLVSKNKEEVNKLQQKILKRGLGEEIGRKVFDAANLVTIGGLKGFVERGIGRGTGAKTLNYIELEKNIAKNLKLLEKANKSKTKSQLEKTLNEITKNVGIGISKTGEFIEKIPGIAEEAPRKSVQSLMEAARTKMPIGMTIKDVSKEGFKEAGVPEKLIQEARKYKSAEEFIKAQGTPVYHSSSEKFANGKPNFDAYFGDADWKKAFAKEFGVNEYEVVLPKNKKILDLNKNTPEANAFIEKWGGSREDFYDEDWVDKYKIFPEVKKSGYDGAKFQGEYILSKDLINEIKTKSQLEEIWNKAQEKPTIKKETPKVETKSTEEPLVQETKKYKSADEWIKSLDINYEDSWKGNKDKDADRLLALFDGKVFHGTNAADEIIKNGYKKDNYFNSGVYFSDTPDVAIGYMKQGRSRGGKSSSVLVNDLSNLKIKIQEGTDGDIIRKINKLEPGIEEYVLKLKKQGYDGIKSRWGETLVWNTQKIKTPQSLTDIWNKANKNFSNVNGMSKFKSAEGLVKAQLDKLSETTKSPITVYRGEGKGIGNVTLVEGRYFADSKKFASRFGKVSKSEIPAGSKIFDLDKVKDGKGIIPQELLVDPKNLTKFLIDNGFDATKNTNVSGVEYVLLNKKHNELLDIAMKSKSPETFNKKVLDRWDYFRDEINRIGADGSKPGFPGYKSPTQKIWEESKTIKQVDKK